MPVVSEFFGIKIFMYWDEHLPEHFHAEYGSHRCVVSIRDAVSINGVLPAKQLKLVLAWCEIHKDRRLENWENARQHKEITKIEPLK